MRPGLGSTRVATVPISPITGCRQRIAARQGLLGQQRLIDMHDDLISITHRARVDGFGREEASRQDPERIGSLRPDRLIELFGHAYGRTFKSVEAVV